MATKPKPEAKEPPLYDPPKAGAAAPILPKASSLSEPAHDVAESTTVDHTLVPDAEPRKDETLEEAIARVGAVREKNRKEWGEFSQKLALPKRHGYHTHWFNDVAGRIDEALASGWTHRINPRDSKPYHRVVGTGRDGKAQEAFAMDLPDVFWKEEMDARHKVASDRIDAIKKNPFQSKPGQAQASDQGKFYDPTESGAGPLQVVKA
jgi:hypothetical protein